MKNFFAAIIFAVMALNFSAGSAAEIPLTSAAAGDIYIALKLDTRDKEFPFTVENIDIDSDTSDENLKSWKCDWIEKSTGKTVAKILLAENANKNLSAAMVVSSLELVNSSEDWAMSVIALTFSMPGYFGFSDAACKKMYGNFMADPSAGEWKDWDDAHEKCIHVVSMRDDKIIGFAVYATDSE